MTETGPTATVLLSDTGSPLTATVVPDVGMICASLSDGGTELLGQRRGLEAYRRDGKTFGIPLLYPWANRLGGFGYRVGDTEVSLTVGQGGVRGEENGLPIHGLLAAYPGWEVTDVDGHAVTARLDLAADARVMAGFPFPHELTITVSLADRTLRYRTQVRATGDVAVPLCYGYHPYLQVPGVPRREWVLDTPALRHLAVDDRGIPTGETSPVAAARRPLGEQAWDDGFDEVAAGAQFTVSGGGRSLTVTVERGFGAAQIFAPLGSDVVCFEPMTAPTDALRRGGFRSVAPGEVDVTEWSVTVG